MEAAGGKVRPLEITVLTGGPSSEREVSLDSGRAVAEALRRCGHHVTAADISPDDTSALGRAGLDAVFIALHGAFGEDGQVQRLCEARGLTYVGSGPDASQRAMDKDASKRTFRQAGLATPDWALIEASQTASQRADAAAGVPPPCVVKPVDSGSSVDVYVARDGEAQAEALELLLDKYGRAMIETFISGREVTVSVLGRQPLPVLEIRPAEEFYNYRAKYSDDRTEYLVNPDLPPAVTRNLQAAGLKAHQVLGCRDFSRVDFILDGNAVPWVLEVNTIPGFTSHSLLPKAAAAAGISFEQLCDRIVRLAMDRSGR